MTIKYIAVYLSMAMIVGITEQKLHISAFISLV